MEVLLWWWSSRARGKNDVTMGGCKVAHNVNTRKKSRRTEYAKYFYNLKNINERDVI